MRREALVLGLWSPPPHGFVPVRSLFWMALALTFLAGCYFFMRWAWPGGGILAAIAGISLGWVLLLGGIFSAVTWMDRREGDETDP